MSVYDRIRSPRADEAGRLPGQTGDFESLRGAKYTLLVTFKRSGDSVATPVWAGLAENGCLYVRTERDSAKVRRIRNDGHVRVAASDVRGKPRGPVIEGRARIVGGDEEAHAEHALKEHYGLGRQIYERTIGAAAPAVYIEVSPAGQEVPQ